MNSSRRKDAEVSTYVEGDCDELEQDKVSRNIEPNLPFEMQTRQISRSKSTRRNNWNGEDFVVDTIDLERLAEEFLGLVEQQRHKNWTLFLSG